MRDGTTAKGETDDSWSPFDDSHQPAATPEEQLAIAKLTVMLECLGGRCREAGANRELVRDEAHRWFFERSDFEWWCEVAGFEPDYVRERARNVFENGLAESSMRRKGRRLTPMSTEEKRLRNNAYARKYSAIKRRNRGY